MKSIPQYLDEDEIKWADKPYIHLKSNGEFVPVSFGEFISDVKNLAKAFNSLGMKGKAIVIYGANCYEWLVCDLAAMGYGEISMPIDKEWTAYDLENVLKNRSVGAFFFSESKRDTAEQIMKNHRDIKFFSLENDLKSLIVTGSTLDGSFLTPENDLDKTVKILFTSGTTDIPKAIPLTTGNMFANWDTLYMRTPMTEADSSYLFLPLNHVYSGVANFLYTIISGMEIYLCADMREIHQDIIKVRPTVVCTVPLLLKRAYLAMTEELLDALRGIRFLYNGGSFTEPDIKEWFLSNGVNVLEAYGTTETSSVIALARVVDGKAENEASVFENLTVKILDPDENGVGEILVKGASRTAGYLDCADNGKYFDSEGFYHTGDLGSLDNEGHLLVRGRKKRMLETSDGKNVYADEIEELLTAYPAIHRAKVYLEDYHITAAVYADGEEKDKISAYIEQVNGKLPRYKKIKRVHFFDDKLGARMK